MLETVALTDDSVLAIMGQLDVTSIIANMNFSQRDTQLVCLDRRTGKEKWTVRPQQLPGDTLQQMELSGSPLVVGDNVYLTAHGTGGLQFQDCYLLCLDLGGHFKWASYIASANVGVAIFDGDYNDQNASIPQLAYSGGRIFVLSNIGALASVDAFDWRWLREAQPVIRTLTANNPGSAVRQSLRLYACGQKRHRQPAALDDQSGHHLRRQTFRAPHRWRRADDL